MNPEKIVGHLSSFPNRATCGKYADDVLQYLSSLFPESETKRAAFKTPSNYLFIVFWLIVGLLIGLISGMYYPIFGILTTLFFGLSAIRYFNWLPSAVTSFPPIKTSYNLVVKGPKLPTAKAKVILMAHWDTAPISILYKPGMVGSFRSSLKMNMLLIVLSMFLSVLNGSFPNSILHVATWFFVAYFAGQLIIASYDFFRLGYSNGSSDNATGVAAAIATAKNAWKMELGDTDIELVLTGAEEVGMIGAKAYYDQNKGIFDDNTLLINFDTLGAGDLKIITKTGSWGLIEYNNELVETAIKVANETPLLNHVKVGSWHTADFDSVWFNRVGMKTITLAALDKNGRMPNIHRETDVLSNVDFKPMNDAIELASRIIASLYKQS